MIQAAVEMGLARLSELCIDGTRILANANRHKTWTAARVEKRLAELDVQIGNVEHKGTKRGRNKTGTGPVC